MEVFRSEYEGGGGGILQTKLARIMHYRLYNVDYGSCIMFHESNFYWGVYVKHDQDSRDRASLMHL